MGKHAIGFAPRLLPAPQAAQYLGISETLLRDLDIPRRELRAKRLYDRIDLDAFADSLNRERDPGIAAHPAPMTAAPKWGERGF